MAGYIGSKVVSVSTDAADITGNITVGGTVDGRDIATDGTKLDGVEASATADQTNAEIRAAVEAATDSNVFTDADHTKLNAIEASATADQTKSDIEGLGIDVPAANLTGTIDAARLSTATTQAESDDSTKIATTAYVVDKITTLIGGAPSTLNDLNELAAAINDDSNYNSTLTTALATKLPLAGGTMTGALTTTGQTINNAGQSQSALSIGGGSTNAALTLRGSTGSAYAWQVSSNAHVASALEFTKSTAVGGTTFSTPSMVLSTDGRLGLGISNPAYTLSAEKDVDTWVSRIYNTGSDADAAGLLVRTDATAAHDAIAFGVYADSGYKMVVRSSGNVGIGTSSPSALLQVAYAPSNTVGDVGISLKDKDNAIEFGLRLDATSKDLHLDRYFNGGWHNHMSFDRSTGNVGIGTSAPDSELQIMNNNSSSYRFGYNGTSDVYLDADHVYFRTDNGGANTACITPTGLGIGTTSPDNPLEVVGSDSGIKISSASSSRPHLRFECGSDEKLRLSANAAYGAIGDSSDANRYMVFKDGNVGIGELNPQAKLEVNGIAMMDSARLSSNSGTSYWDIRRDSSTGHLVVKDDGLGDVITVLQASGDVGIGNTGGYGKLNVAGSVAVVANDANKKVSFWSTGNGNSENAKIAVDNDGSTTNTGEMKFSTKNASGTLAERSRITAAGHVLVGRTTSSGLNNAGHLFGEDGYVYHTRTGNIMWINTLSSSATAITFAASGTTKGNIVINTSSVSYNTTSDYRLKTDAQPMTGATARLKQLNPVNFEWIEDGTRTDGFLAHEAQAIVPEAVTGTKDEVDDDGVAVMQGIDQSKLVPLLVKTIQELEARITALEA